ncbi:MAG: hypothetical protein AB3N23_22180 [Paracoccaceae bacterium]
MIRAALGFCALMLLSACGTKFLFYKEGVSRAAFTQDQTQCQADARRAVPPNNAKQRKASIRVPSKEICDTNGACWIQPAYEVPGGYETVDLNDEPRFRAYARCMAHDGYRLLELPSCSSAAARKGPGSTPFPTLTSDSCVVRRADGTKFVLNPS